MVASPETNSSTTGSRQAGVPRTSGWRAWCHAIVTDGLAEGPMRQNSGVPGTGQPSPTTGSCRPTMRPWRDPMPIVEYPAGSPFPGVIGRTADESSPAWPAPPRAPQGRPERPVRRPRRHGVRAARLLRQPDRDADLRRARGGRPALQQHAHDGAVLAEPRVHHHRAQPPQQRHGRASPSSPPATPATTASCRSRTACSPRCCSSTATARTWSASGT